MAVGALTMVVVTLVPSAAAYTAVYTAAAVIVLFMSGTVSVGVAIVMLAERRGHGDIAKVCLGVAFLMTALLGGTVDPWLFIMATILAVLATLFGYALGYPLSAQRERDDATWRDYVRRCVATGYEPGCAGCRRINR